MSSDSLLPITSAQNAIDRNDSIIDSQSIQMVHAQVTVFAGISFGGLPESTSTNSGTMTNPDISSTLHVVSSPITGSSPVPLTEQSLFSPVPEHVSPSPALAITSSTAGATTSTTLTDNDRELTSNVIVPSASGPTQIGGVQTITISTSSESTGIVKNSKVVLTSESPISRHSSDVFLTTFSGSPASIHSESSATSNTMLPGESHTSHTPHPPRNLATLVIAIAVPTISILAVFSYCWFRYRRATNSLRWSKLEIKHPYRVQPDETGASETFRNCHDEILGGSVSSGSQETEFSLGLKSIRDSSFSGIATVATRSSETLFPEAGDFNLKGKTAFDVNMFISSEDEVTSPQGIPGGQVVGVAQPQRELVRLQSGRDSDVTWLTLVRRPSTREREGEPPLYDNLFPRLEEREPEIEFC